MEGLFFGAGGAGVVVAVASTILIGLALWMWRAERRLSELERDIKDRNA